MNIRLWPLVFETLASPSSDSYIALSEISISFLHISMTYSLLLQTMMSMKVIWESFFNVEKSNRSALTSINANLANPKSNFLVTALIMKAAFHQLKECLRSLSFRNQKPSLNCVDFLAWWISIEKTCLTLLRFKHHCKSFLPTLAKTISDRFLGIPIPRLRSIK